MGRRIRFERAYPPRPRWGTWTWPTAAERQRPGIHLNRYPHEVIGIWVTFGGHRYLSWVWPIRITGLRLTREQFDRQFADVRGADDA